LPRPELQVLEDRLPPGQMWLGSTLGASFLAPSLTALQLDAAGDEAGVPAAPVDLQSASSGASALALTDAVAVPAQASFSFVNQAPVQTTSSTPASGTDGGNALQSGTTGLNQDGDLAGLAASAQRHIPGVASGALSANQPTSDAGGTSVSLVGSGGAIGFNGNLPPAVTAPQPALLHLTTNYGVHKGVAHSGGIPAPAQQGLGGGGGPLDVQTGPNVNTITGSDCPNGRGVIQSETAITSSFTPSGNEVVVVAYNDFRGFYCPQNGYQVTGWSYSVDGGQTFTEGKSLPGTTSLGGDPWLATGPDGTIYFASLYQPLYGMAILRGTPDDNAGVIWSQPTIIHTNGESYDKEAIAVDQNDGTIYVTFTGFGSPGGINLYRSQDGGLTFQGPYHVSSTGSAQGSSPAVGPNGEVYVAYGIGYPSDSGIGFAVSYDQGITWQDSHQIATVRNQLPLGADRSPAFPHIAVDTTGGPYTGNIYIAYQSATLSNKLDALMISSYDGGQTWNPPLQMNDDGGVGIQWMPTISVDANGFVNSFFYDRRDHPGTAYTALYFTQSQDGGQTFIPNIMATDQFSFWTQQSDGSPSWGDYMNAVSDGNDTIVAYADGRDDGHPDAYFIRASFS
jgi:hypothetical protein